MENAAKKLERFFLTFLFINPFLDIISGMYIKLSETLPLPSVTPSLVFRMVLLVMFAIYILMRRNWKSVLIIGLVIVAWGLSLAGEFRYYYSIQFMTDFQYIVRFIYNLGVILVYGVVFKNSGISKDELLKYIVRAFVFTGLVLSASILLSYVLGVGYYTYGDRFGFRGSRGFFYSGNDITAALMMLLPVSFYGFFTLEKSKDITKKRRAMYLLSPACAIMSLFLIGTKTAFMAIFAGVGVMGLYALILLLKNKERKYLKRFLAIVGATVLLFGVLMVVSQAQLASTIRESWSQPGNVLTQTDTMTAILSGRQYKLSNAITMWQRTTPFSAMFGVGRGTQTNVIEMDIFEVFFYYGVFGAVVMLWLYIKTGFGFVLKLFKSFDLMGLTLLVSIGMCAGYMIMAGHVLFSVTSGFYFAFLLIFSRLYYSEQAEDIKII